MATCETNECYMKFLGTEITNKLGHSAIGKQCLGSVLSVVEHIAICRSLRQITTEEADNLTSVVYGLYPLFVESLKAKLEEKYLA